MVRNGATGRWRKQLSVSFAATHSCQTISFRSYLGLDRCIHLGRRRYDGKSDRALEALEAVKWQVSTKRIGLQMQASPDPWTIARGGKR